MAGVGWVMGLSGMAAAWQDPHADGYDVLILDAGHKQSLASVRSLGRAGLRVALGESFVEYRPSLPVPAFRSRYCAYKLTLPSYAEDADAFGDAVTGFVREHPTQVVLPTGDGVIAALAPRRKELAELGCTLAVAPDSALEIATDKDRTLEVASRLGIPQPRTRRFDSLDELPSVLSEFAFPFVLKPSVSWTGNTSARIVPSEVVNEAEATELSREFIAAGSSVLAQQWASGRREGVTLFIADGEVVASCGHIAHRTSPPLGGASVMRESIAVPPDIYDSAIRLAKAVGIEGVCEVEFRRDADGHPLLMEINPRLAGTIENAVHSGVDFPLMIWQWATGRPVTRTTRYRTGVRTRWLHGDLRWLRDNQLSAGRPDTVSRVQSLLTFGTEFFRTRYYDCFDWHDLRPFMAEMRVTAAVVRRSQRSRSTAVNADGKGALHASN
jgi:predicted ATP-grasp superfamily ATP-dependent carboligase